MKEPALKGMTLIVDIPPRLLDRILASQEYKTFFNCCSRAQPLFNIKYAAGQPINFVEIEIDLFAFHLVKVADGNEHSRDLVRQQLNLIGAEETNVRRLNLRRDLVKSLEMAKREDFSIRQDGRKILLGNIKRRRKIDDPVFAAGTRLKKDIGEPA